MRASPTLSRVVAEARSWVGTPYQHLGRVKGSGCDCVGLPFLVGRALGLDVGGDLDWYSALPSDGRAEAEVRRRTVLVAEAPRRLERYPGGLIAMLWVSRRGVGQHLGVLAYARSDPTRVTMIHATRSAGRVVEAGLSEKWRKRILSLHAIPGSLS